MTTDAAMPADDPLTVAEAEVTRDGGQFGATEDALVHCFTCGRDFPAAGIDASASRRLEGASDPADMLLVVGVTCPHCGTGGSLTLHYGPESTIEDAEVVRALDRDGA